MSMFDQRRRQMKDDPGKTIRIKRTMRRLKINRGLGNNLSNTEGELVVADALTGESWRAREPMLPLRITTTMKVADHPDAPPAYVHLKCTVPDYFKLALRPSHWWTAELAIVSDLPDGVVVCPTCGEEF